MADFVHDGFVLSLSLYTRTHCLATSCLMELVVAPWLAITAAVVPESRVAAESLQLLFRHRSSRTTEGASSP